MNFKEYKTNLKSNKMMKIINNIIAKFNNIAYFLYIGVIAFFLHIVFTNSLYETVCHEVINYKKTNSYKYLYVIGSDSIIRECSVDSTIFSNYIKDIKESNEPILHCYNDYDYYWWFYFILFISSFILFLFWSGFRYNW